jgi:hypothetical protein
MTTAKMKEKVWPPIHASKYDSGAKEFQVARVLRQKL